MLARASSEKTRQWWEKYLKGVIPFQGIGIPEIRNIVASWREQTGLAQMPENDQLRVALALFEEAVAEDKLAGVLFLQYYLYDKFPCRELIGKYETLFSRNLIFDWNTCDWFCVRVLGPTIARYKEPAARAISSWRNATNVWQARSSVVPFVKVASEERYYPYIEAACTTLIRRDERFAKTAVGWLLRDVSKHNRGFVRVFMDNRIKHFSIESAKNAMKYFEKKEREQYLRLLKGAPPEPTENPGVRVDGIHLGIF